MELKEAEESWSCRFRDGSWHKKIEKKYRMFEPHSLLVPVNAELWITELF